MAGLDADPRRQARSAHRGYDYQIARSIRAWLDLGDGERLVLEGAEDFDRLTGEDAVVGQARHTAGSGNVTLRTKGVIAAINDFWTHRERNRQFRIRYHYWTTSGIGLERGRPFGKARAGLRLWSAIRAAPQADTSLADAGLIAAFLREQPNIRPEVRSYLDTATPAEVIARLILPIEWNTKENREDLRAQIDDELASHGKTFGVYPEDAQKAYHALYCAAVEAARTDSAPPLTRADFLRVFQDATSSRVPFREQRAAGRIGAGPQDEALRREAEARLRRHVVAANRSFSIFGVTRLLSMDTAWVDLPIIMPTSAETGEPATIEEIREFHRDGGYAAVNMLIPCIANISIGWFYRHCVVVGGPGLGKSMLTRKLALAYARDGFPVVRVDVKALAPSLRRGATFLESILTLGLHDSGVSPEAVMPAFLASGVLLCDGLDEAGDAQDLIARHLAAFCESHPGCRAVVTTRPIGYETPHLAGWRHYEILALDPDRAGQHVERLLAGIHPDASTERHATLALVEQQLKRNRDSELLTHSPLLLGFAVLLGLHRVAFGDGRTDLYTRVFERIEQVPNARVDARPLGSLAIRCAEVLGWVLTTDPGARLSRVRAQCADILADELGASRLKAETTFEECLAFWQQTGLVERVRHAGEEMLLFVHKTLGEYAGARYLASLPDEAREAAILSRSRHAASIELLKFAGGLGLAASVARALLAPGGDGVPHAARIGHCLALVADNGGGLPAGLVAEILDAAFALARSTPAAAGLICPPLLRAAKAFPDEVAQRAHALRDDPRNWVRLAAWACLATAGARHYDLDALVALFLDLPALGMHPEDFGPPPGSTARDDVQDLAIACASAAFGEIIRELPAERSNALLAALTSKISKGTTPPPVRFTRNIVTLFRSAGRDEDADRVLGRWGLFTPEGMARRARQQEQMLETVLDLLPDGAGEAAALEDVTDAHAPFLHLGAFLEASGYRSTRSSSLEDWQKPYDREAARAVIGALVTLGGIDPAGLGMDAQRLRAEIAAQPEAALPRALRVAGYIDIAGADYGRARTLDLSPALIEKATRHPSSWIATAAEKILKELRDLFSQPVASR